MLRIAHPSPTGAIFQAIVLPRLAVLRPVQRSVFCTTAPTCAPGIEDSTATAGPSWVPWTRAPTSASRKSAERKPQGAGGKERSDHRPIPVSEDPFWDSLSSSSKIALRAAERIINIHVPPASSRKSAASASTVAPDTQIPTTTQSLPSVSRSPNPSESPIDITTLPFPPPLYALLRQRLFRLAVFKILQTAEYATDPRLVENTASYLERGGAGKLAMRLRRSCAKTSASPSSTLAALDGIKSSSLALPAPEQAPKPRARLWSESDTKDRPRRPPDHWRHLTTISSSLSLGDLPPSLYPKSQSSPKFPKRGGLSPLEKAQRQRALTAYYNHHLSRLVSSPSSSPDPIGISTSSLGRPSRAPTPKLQQLRDLTLRIRELERCRGFKPDRVTANILVKCWLRCGLAIPSISRSHPAGKKQNISDAWREEDLKAMWSLMKRLMSLGSTSPRLPGQYGRPTPLPLTTDGTQGEILEYGKHIRPFCSMILRAARSLGAQDLADEVIAFQAEQKRLLCPDLFHHE